MLLNLLQPLTLDHRLTGRHKNMLCKKLQVMSTGNLASPQYGSVHVNWQSSCFWHHQCGSKSIVSKGGMVHYHCIGAYIGMATTNILDIYCPEVHPWSVPTLQHCNSITPGAWCRRCFWQRAFPHLRKLGSPKYPIAKVGLETGKLEDKSKKKSKKITSFGFQDILSLDARL